MSVEDELREALAEIRRLHTIIGELQGVINARTGEPLDFATFDGMAAEEVAQSKAEMERLELHHVVSDLEQHDE